MKAHCIESTLLRQRTFSAVCIAGLYVSICKRHTIIPTLPKQGTSIFNFYYLHILIKSKIRKKNVCGSGSLINIEKIFLCLI